MSYLIQNEVIKDLEIAEGFKLIDLDDVKKICIIYQKMVRYILLF